MRTPRISTPTSGLTRDTRELIELRDGTSVLWHVEEVVCADTPGARAPRCLVFTSDFTMRRVWNFPSGWQALDDEALLRLSWER